MQYYTLSHAGIPGMKWHRRRWRNYDGSLTEAGKIRYGVGGDKAVKKAEKERLRRNKILSDPKKLQRHASEFSTEELKKAKDRFDAINELKNQYRLEKLSAAKNKTDIATAIANTEKQKAEAKAAKQKNKFDKLRFEREEARKDERSKKEMSMKKWQTRMLNLSNILKISKDAKSIFDELGVTDPKDGSTLFGSLGKAMGWGNKSADSVINQTKEQSGSSGSSSKSETKSSGSNQNGSVSAYQGAFAGWASNAKYNDKKAKLESGKPGGLFGKVTAENRFAERYKEQVAANTIKNHTAPTQQKISGIISSIDSSLSTSGVKDSAVAKDASKAASKAVANSFSVKVSEVTNLMRPTVTSNYASQTAKNQTSAYQLNQRNPDKNKAAKRVRKAQYDAYLSQVYKK